jgi:hypothetical protein
MPHKALLAVVLVASPGGEGLVPNCVLLVGGAGLLQALLHIR